VHFNTDDWRVDRDGLIYTDRLFEKELCVLCDKLGLAGDDVSYSEQGMQGDNYVSCDVGAEFIASWIKVRGRAEIDEIKGPGDWELTDDETDESPA
jgi:hypothetical protein